MRKLLSLLFTLGLLPLAAQPQIAVVDMDAVFRQYHRKLSVEKKVQAQIDALRTSSRVLAVQEADAKLKELASTVRDKQMPAETRELAAQEFDSLAIEYQGLLREMEEYLNAEKRKATLYLVENLEAIMLEVRTETSLIGKEQDFDLVLEKSGKTSSQISPIIYLREKTDITDIVLERLNAQSPPASEAKEESDSGPS